MSAALKLNPETQATEKLSRKPPLGEKRPRPRLVWENPRLSAGTHKKKLEAKPNSSYGRVLYNYFRDYDPAIGRYIQSDRIGLQGGLNTYTYVLNSPLKFVDPRGLDASLYPKDPNTADPTDFTDGYVPPAGPEVSDIVSDATEVLSTCEGQCNALVGAICGPAAAASGSTGPGAFLVFAVCKAEVALMCKACPDEPESDCKKDK